MNSQTDAELHLKSPVSALSMLLKRFWILLQSNAPEREEMKNFVVLLCVELCGRIPNHSVRATWLEAVIRLLRVAVELPLLVSQRRQGLLLLALRSLFLTRILQRRSRAALLISEEILQLASAFSWPSLIAEVQLARSTLFARLKECTKALSCCDAGNSTIKPINCGVGIQLPSTWNIFFPPNPPEELNRNPIFVERERLELHLMQVLLYRNKSVILRILHEHRMASENLCLAEEVASSCFALAPTLQNELKNSEKHRRYTPLQFTKPFMLVVHPSQISNRGTAPQNTSGTEPSKDAREFHDRFESFLECANKLRSLKLGGRRTRSGTSSEHSNVVLHDNFLSRDDYSFLAQTFRLPYDILISRPQLAHFMYHEEVKL